MDYLLIGKIRWLQGRGRVEPGAGEPGAHPDRARRTAPTTRWQQPIDAALTDVFAVQADIAAKVADALGVVLGDSARRELTVKPTESLAAYDEFLKGEAASQEMKADQAGLRRAIAFYQRAVALDSTFAQAWSQLSRARTSLYSNGVPDPALGDAARVAAERARAAQAERSAGLSGRRRFLRERQPDRQRAGRGGVRAGTPARARTTWTCSARLAIAETSLGRWDGVRRAARARLAARSALGHGGAPAGDGAHLPPALRRRRLGGRPGDRARADQPRRSSRSR